MLVLRVLDSCATAKGTVLRSLSCPKRSACLAGILPRTSDLGMVPMRLPRLLAGEPMFPSPSFMTTGRSSIGGSTAEGGVIVWMSTVTN